MHRLIHTFPLTGRQTPPQVSFKITIRSDPCEAHIMFAVYPTDPELLQLLQPVQAHDLQYAFSSCVEQVIAPAKPVEPLARSSFPGQQASKLQGLPSNARHGT